MRSITSTPLATVLFIDDDENLLSSFVRQFRHASFRVITETSGEGALLRLSSDKVDVVVCDDCMPGMSGAEVLASIHGRWPWIVSIMLSGRAEMETLIVAINSGRVFHYIQKPCECDAVDDAIHRALAYKAARDVLVSANVVDDFAPADERFK